jgi:hypothetical protein
LCCSVVGVPPLKSLQVSGGQRLLVTSVKVAPSTRKIRTDAGEYVTAGGHIHYLVWSSKPA